MQLKKKIPEDRTSNTGNCRRNFTNLPLMVEFGRLLNKGA